MSGTALGLLVLWIGLTALFGNTTLSIARQQGSAGNPQAAGGGRPTEVSGGKLLLTDRERQWLSRHDGQIRIGITVIPPQVLRSDGHYHGLSIDYIRLMERKLGCGFELVPYQTWNQIIKAAMTRRIDMIFAAQETPERTEYLLFTEPYIELPNMIVVRKDRQGGADLARMKGWHVAASEGSAVHEYLKQEFPDLILYPVPDELSGLIKVSVGEADAMVVETSRASYYIEKAGILNLRVSGSAGLLYRLRFAVRKDWPVLRGILDKGLAAVTDEERRAINRRWIMVGGQGILASRTFWIAFGSGMGLILLSVTGVIVWNRTLRRTVRQRTSQLQQELVERRQVETALRESEEKYRRIVDTAGEGIWVVDPDARTTFVNDRMAEMLGCSGKEMIGRPMTDFIFEEDGPGHVRKTENRDQGVPEFYERRFRHKDGRTVWTHVSATPIFDAGYQFNGSFGMFTDITEQKQAETRLNEQLHFLQQMLDSVPIPIFYKDRQGLYLGCNAAFEESTCLARKDIVGKTVHEVVPKDRADIHHEADLALLSRPGMRTYEVSGTHKDGKHRDVIFKKTTFFDAHDRVAGIVGTQMDITELKRAERERLANLKFFECMDRINRAIQGAGNLETMMRDLLDIVLDIFDCDRAFLLFPCDPESSTWSIPMERNKPEYPGALELESEMPMDIQIAEALRILLETDGPVAFGPETAHSLPDEVAEQFGSKCFMSMAVCPRIGRPWQFGIHQCTHVRIWSEEEKRLFLEISRRLADGLGTMLAHRELRNSLDKLEQAQRIAHIGSWELDLIHDVFSWSDEVCRIFEIDRKKFGASYAAFLNIVHPDDREAVDSAFSKAVETRAPFAIDHRLLFSDGRVKYVHEQCVTDYEGDKPTRSLGTVQDITERKTLEVQLRQSQKMEAVGQLAGGVAHDFNNMLGVIIGHAELALENAALDDSQRKDLEEILEAARRSAEVTRQLLAFARKQTIEPRILDLNETVEGILKLLRRLIGEDIDLVWRPGAAIWPIKVDPSQLDQILANLCVNARDAIHGVGQIIIETRNVQFGNESWRGNMGFQPGEHVELVVSDTGSGMDKSTLDKIFEPFFTTKEVGKGTGMGLATIYGIVKQNAGFIKVTSKPGQGSTFRIFLPRHTAAAGEAPPKSPKPGHLRGHETILVVEDEPSHLRMVGLMLEKFGYQVLTASSPGEALLLAERHSGEINLMLSDLIMPEMNGRDLAKELASLCPDTLCMFMSGYTGETIAHHGVLDEGIPFIHKPFSQQALAAKIREVLDCGHIARE